MARTTTTYSELLVSARNAINQSYIEEVQEERKLCVERANAYIALATEMRNGAGLSMQQVDRMKVG